MNSALAAATMPYLSALAYDRNDTAAIAQADVVVTSHPSWKSASLRSFLVTMCCLCALCLPIEVRAEHMTEQTQLCWPVWPPTPDLWEQQRRCQSEGWWERFKARPNDFVSTKAWELGMIGPQWDFDWAVNTDLEPLPSLPVFEASEQQTPSTSKPPQQKQPHIHSLPSINPQAHTSCRTALETETHSGHVLASRTAKTRESKARQSKTSTRADLDLENAKDIWQIDAPMYLFV